MAVTLRWTCKPGQAIPTQQMADRHRYSVTLAAHGVYTSGCVLRYRPGEGSNPCYRRQLCGCGQTPASMCGQNSNCVPSLDDISADIQSSMEGAGKP